MKISDLGLLKRDWQFSGAPGSVRTTPNHPELGGEKAEGMAELDGPLSGRVTLVPELFFFFG